jgi:hypothetical protein
MPEATVSVPLLKGEDRTLLLELLELERQRLLIETRHTDARQYREQLHRRLDHVERLAEEMRPIVTP